MKCFNCPCDVVDPYPPAGTGVAEATMTSSLVLFRPKEGVIANDGSRPRFGEDLYLTGADLTLTWVDNGSQSHEIRVPPGFVTDLTSVPPIFRLLVSRAGPWLEAAIVHDYLYVAWQSLTDNAPTSADRRFADILMLQAMKAAKVSLWRRFAIFVAVRLGGGATFRQRDRFRFGDATDPRLVHLAAVSDLEPPQ